MVRKSLVKIHECKCPFQCVILDQSLWQRREDSVTGEDVRKRNAFHNICHVSNTVRTPSCLSLSPSYQSPCCARPFQTFIFSFAKDNSRDGGGGTELEKWSPSRHDVPSSRPTYEDLNPSPSPSLGQVMSDWPHQLYHLEMFSSGLWVVGGGELADTLEFLASHLIWVSLQCLTLAGA